MATLDRIFSKRQPLGPAEKALAEIPKVVKKRGCPGNCTHEDVAKLISQLVVAIGQERSQKIDVGKEEAHE